MQNKKKHFFSRLIYFLLLTNVSSFCKQRKPNTYPAERNSKAVAKSKIIKKISKKTLYAHLDYSYPQLADVPQELNEQIEQLIQNQIKKDRQAAREHYDFYVGQQKHLDTHVLLHVTEYGALCATGDYTIVQHSKKYISIEFAFCHFYCGCAHPNKSWITFNYDLEKKKCLSLEDFFPNDCAYLEKISKLCKKNYGDRFDAQLDPEKANFSTFAFDDNFLYFYIDWPYATAGQIKLVRTELA